MIRAPKIEDGNLSRPVRRPRSHSYAPLQLMTVRQSPDSEAQDTNRPKKRKTPAQVAPKSSQTRARKSKAKAAAPIKSP
jgi:hypothetical protein